MAMVKSTFGMGRDSGDAKSCVLEAVKDFKNPRMILFFSGEKNFCEYARILHEMFPDCISMGCSAYRMWNSQATEKDVLNVLAIESGITCTAGVIEKSDNFALGYADHVRRCLEEIDSMENTICVEFTVPYKRTEEYTLMVLNSVLLRSEIPVIGGTAANLCADTRVSEEAFVALNGRIYTDGCVFSLLHSTDSEIFLYRENIYEPLTGRELVATKANDITRTIMTYDNKPAAEVYAEELGVPEEEIRKYFFHYPMGRRVGRDTYVTAIQDVGANGSMKHYARVHEGTRLMVMKEGDYKKITRQTIAEIREKTEHPSLVLLFHCVARTVLFEKNGYVDEYQQLLSGAFPNFIGFSCLGEQFCTKNFNHTMMFIVFE